MVFNVPDGGLSLDSSAKAMAGLPVQAFGITLSNSVIEDMIACVQNGGDIELSLGSNPAFLFGDHEVEIPNSPDSYDYDLFYSDAVSPRSLKKLPNPAMGIFKPPRVPRPNARKPAAKAPAQKTSSSNTTPISSNEADDAIANLKHSLARKEAEKNTAVVVSGLMNTKGKVKPSNRLLDNASPRSLPPSPALSGVRSPSLAPGGSALDQTKQHTFPIIHQLAVSELSFEDLFSQWNEGSEDEFRVALNKVADFDNNLQKWTLRKRYWKELDVFEYDYGKEEDRQTAINNAVKQFDRMRVGVSDPIWQKLLPVAERGKGTCLSKLQANFAKGPTVPKPKPDAANGSGSEREDSTALKKGKGGEPMSRSSSQASVAGKKKPLASEAQAKRLTSTTKKAVPVKASPKVSPTKPQAKAATGKGGRGPLSEEFVKDSDSEEEPLAKSKATIAAAPRPMKAAPALASKPKATTATKTLPKETEKDTIRAEVVAKPAKATKPAAKRSRDAEEDDSSSSGTPLSKRVKAGSKAPATAASSAKPRTVSDASQNGRPSSSAPKVKNTSPTKSSPLALSPQNASELELERVARAKSAEREREREQAQIQALKRERERNRERAEKERERGRGERTRELGRDRPRAREPSRDTIISSASSNADSTIGIPVVSKKRPAPVDSYSENHHVKRMRVSADTLTKAQEFKLAYQRYLQLHEEISGWEFPPESKLNDFCELHSRLQRMKRDIYQDVGEA
ncbi:hypothetical protein QBC36DRAFT_106818 [Triangularia setosa]|uniref:E3 ubiquitin-protein ligase UBR1-like winged-helix domain-containing protein n=1 Tax=Triangularia setosa TaxID=2587417 RepID=A0AAN6WIZ6_9PEZI|nr:hypothetical protein QBC36DRAFT_106818 [Podospora setosa]